MEQEEQALRNLPATFPTIDSQGNPFDNSAGFFWGIQETRPYMSARQNMVDLILAHFGTFEPRVDGVEIALSHLLDLLRLCRKDNMGMRDLVPALYLALDRDQEAYDFMKWWATTAQESTYNWMDMSLPHLHIKNADILEEPMDDWVTGNLIDLSHVLVVILIKLRVLSDLKNIQSATRAFAGVLPLEVTDIIRGHLAGKVLGARPRILMGGTEDISRLVKTLKKQALRMFRYTKQYNPHFWRMMDGGAADGPTDVPYYATGSKEEAESVMGQVYLGFSSSPETVPLLDAMIKCA